MKYKLTNRTPEELRCGLLGCPAIYEAKEKTPEELKCAAVSCPGVYESEGNYVIIGTKVNPADFGLEKKVGEHEELIQVPKKLIDNMQ